MARVCEAGLGPREGRCLTSYPSEYGALPGALSADLALVERLTWPGTRARRVNGWGVPSPTPSRVVVAGAHVATQPSQLRARCSKAQHFVCKLWPTTGRQELRQATQQLLQHSPASALLPPTQRGVHSAAVTWIAAQWVVVGVVEA